MPETKLNINKVKKWKIYPAYKDSGVEWLDKVPDGWKALPVKRQYTVQLGKMLQNNSESTSDIFVPYIKALHVQWENVDTSDLPDMWASPTDIEKFEVQSGDLLVCEGGEAGRASIIISPPDFCIIQNALHRVREKGADVNYLQYVLHAVGSVGWFDVLCNKTTIAHFTREKLAELRMPLPTKINTQRIIAAFLNRETGQIDALIEKKERQIELLEEKRTALISRAVTKGLDPDVKMKDSGVEWLGDMPEGWEVLPIKRITSVPVTDGPHETPDLFNEGIPFISAEAIKNDKIDFSKKRGFISAEDHRKYSKKYKPQKGDVYMVKSGATTGNVAFVETDDEFNIWSPLAVIRPDHKKAITRFIFFFMKSINFFQSIKLAWSYGTQQNIGMNVIENLPILVPSLPEQSVIANFLDCETGKIDKLIEKINESIAKLREFRTALISAAVTGKIDVRKEVA